MEERWASRSKKRSEGTPLAFAADAGRSMEFQSISARKPLPEVGSRKNVIIDAHRFKHYAWGHDRLIFPEQPDLNPSAA